MRHFIILLAIGLTACAASECFAFQGASSPAPAPRYPRVYGPSGALYGPTQAHYQYQRRYGRPYYGSAGGHYGGYGNFGFRHGGQFHSPGFSHRYRSFYNAPYFGYYSFGYPYSYGVTYVNPGFGNPIGYAYTPMAPNVLQGSPYWLGGDPSNNAVINGALDEEKRRWQQPIDGEAKPKVKRLPKPSTPDAKLRSIRLQARGDEWMWKQDYAQAYQRYKQAIDAAEDRAIVHFRSGYSLVAMSRFSLAVKAFKRGLEIDPSLPVTGDSLSKIYSPENEIAKVSFIHKTSHWVREDIRDPDRLFLLGLLLYFNDDADRAETLFEAAYRLAGEGDHLLAFLNPVDPKAVKQPADGAEPNIPPLPDGGVEPPKPPKPIPMPELKNVEPAKILQQKRLNPKPKGDAGPQLPPLPQP